MGGRHYPVGDPEAGFLESGGKIGRKVNTISPQWPNNRKFGGKMVRRLRVKIFINFEILKKN